MKKMYVLVRKDLSKSQQAVQAGHAVAEYLVRGPSTDWDNGYMILKKVKNEADLKNWMRNLTEIGVECAAFIEPDIGDQMTAFAAVGEDDLDKVLRTLPLL